VKSSPYLLLLLAGIAASLLLWSRLARRDSRLLTIYAAALTGAFLGAKLVYLAAEGWMYWSSPHRWIIWATGKTILGALLGGYLAVEIAKKFVGYRQPTGDYFAVVAPLGILFGRVGCLLHGCCLGRECTPAWWTLQDQFGIDRWPAVPVEMAFNILALAAALLLRKLQLLRGQHFHLYLMSYGIFRFFHEWMRATPRLTPVLTGYQIAALAVTALGVAGFLRRRSHETQNVPISLGVDAITASAEPKKTPSSCEPSRGVLAVALKRDETQKSAAGD
jgi:phosphatidylglycerol:prolipoprotein diacylglycerol transferase